MNYSELIFTELNKYVPNILRNYNNFICFYCFINHIYKDNKWMDQSDTYIDQIHFRIKLVVFDGKSVEESEDIIKKKFNLNHCSITSIETFKTAFYLVSIFEKDHPNNKNMYNKFDDQFIQRFYTRIILLKSGWSDSNIENFIIKHFDIKLDYSKFSIKPLYFLLKKWMNLNSSSINIGKKGRPKLPSELNEFIYQYNLKKRSQNIKKKYIFYKEIINSFNKDDILYLKEAVTNWNAFLKNDEKNDEQKERLIKSLNKIESFF
jgi:hypothetical protein